MLPRRHLAQRPDRGGGPHRHEARRAPRRGRAGGPLTALVLAAVVAAGTSAAAATGCSRDGDQAAAAGGAATEIRLAVLPNVTHAPGLVAVGDGTLADHLGATRLRTLSFSAGPAAMEALLGGAIDMAYVGPTPAATAYLRSDGSALRVVAGSTSGGAALMVRPGIDEPDDLRGRTLASPQLGGTQDVALRTWLGDHGLRTDTAGGGDVEVRPLPGAETLAAFEAGQVDGAWVPEPWATRLEVEAGAARLVDESALWPGGRHATTLLVARTEFLRAHPSTVRDVLAAHLDALDRTVADPVGAQSVVRDQVRRATGTDLDPEVLTAAWNRLRFTPDPLVGTVQAVADDAAELGLQPGGDLTEMFDLAALDRLLVARGDAPVGR